MLEKYTTLVSRDEMVSANSVQLVHILGLGVCGDETGFHLFKRDEFIRRKPELTVLLSSTVEGDQILKGENITKLRNLYLNPNILVVCCVPVRNVFFPNNFRSRH